MAKVANVVLNASPSCSTIERFFSELVSMLTPEKNKMVAETIFHRAATRHAEPFRKALDSYKIPE